MRDKNRIEPFLKRLQEFWEANYDLRFGQIIYILAENLSCNDIFYPEENKWSDALDKAKTSYYNKKHNNVL